MIYKSFDFIRRFTPLIFLTGLAAYGATAIHLGLNLAIAAPIGVVLSIAVLFTLERLAPTRLDENGSGREIARDGFFFGLGAVMDTVGRMAAVAIAVALAGGERLLNLPVWLEVILAIYVAEFFAYWFHRLSHREGWLWSIHSIHHLPEKVNLTNNFLMHPLNIFFLKLMRSTPLLLLGFSQEAVFLHGLLAVGVAFSVHANTGGRLGFWNYLIGTAELHRMHHSKDPREAGNHGTVVPLWDQLFGTFRYNREGQPAAIGVTERERYPVSIAGMLWHPFRRRSIKAAFAAMLILASGAGCAKNFYTEIEIEAESEEVWLVLADNEKYPEWNPYHVRVEGTLEVGEELLIEIHKPNGNQLTIEPRVFRVIPGRELAWGGGVPGLFFGEHIFLLERIAPGRTKLIQKETFDGIFVPFAELGSIKAGYERMNEALKRRVERSR